jgi:predicted Zn-dependent protease with MMP-like domain
MQSSHREPLTLEEFEQVVAETLDGLPPMFQRQIENLAIVVEEWPDRWTMDAAGVRRPGDLLGFYHGIPLTERGEYYGNVAPDKISIYRQPIMMHYRTAEAIRAAVRHTVIHEIAHYFGISDERLDELGAY